MTTTSQINFRIAPETKKFYEKNFQSLYQGGKTVTELFPSIYAATLMEIKEKAKFSEGELSLIVDTLNGTIPTPQLMGQTLAISVRDACNIDRLDEKWGVVDQTSFLKKIKSLTIFQKACLEVWGYTFWWGSEKDGAEIPEGRLQEKIKELVV